MISQEEKIRSVKILEIIWNIFYWTAFGLCWACLPFLMQYSRTGEFTVQTKMKRALYEYFKYYSIVGILGIIGLIYLWTQNAFEK